MIRHFGITTKRGAAMSACAVEFYIWDTSCHRARRWRFYQGISVSAAIVRWKNEIVLE